MNELVDHMRTWFAEIRALEFTYHEATTGISER